MRGVRGVVSWAARVMAHARFFRFRFQIGEGFGVACVHAVPARAPRPRVPPLLGPTSPVRTPWVRVIGRGGGGLAGCLAWGLSKIKRGERLGALGIVI